MHEHLTLCEIKDYFHQCYPFLQIRFFVKPNHLQEIGSESKEWHDDNSVKEAGAFGYNRLLEIHYWQKTGLVESHFSRDFNLNAQIFRKNGHDWVQTSGTDEFTLEEQNEIGQKNSESLLHGHQALNWSEKKL